MLPEMKLSLEARSKHSFIPPKSKYYTDISPNHLGWLKRIYLHAVKPRLSVPGNHGSIHMVINKKQSFTWGWTARETGKEKGLAEAVTFLKANKNY